MRPKVIGEQTLAEIQKLRAAGATTRAIADKFGVGHMTVHYALNGRKAARQVADNDNHPDRTTRMMPHNGGCSTTSGKMPVTLRRIPTMDKPLLPCVANDNQPTQVAA